MSEAPLIIARRLAIRLLHEAQISPDMPVHGLVGAQKGEPESVYPLADAVRRNELEQQLQARGEQLWACYRSNPQAPAMPEESDCLVAGNAYSLIISLDTKGVLEMRCWQWREKQPVERILKIKD
jgi:hypothetical protein